jgi:hypothetical protein
MAPINLLSKDPADAAESDNKDDEDASGLMMYMPSLQNT